MGLFGRLEIDFGRDNRAIDGGRKGKKGRKPRKTCFATNCNRPVLPGTRHCEKGSHARQVESRRSARRK